MELNYPSKAIKVRCKLMTRLQQKSTLPSECFYLPHLNPLRYQLSPQNPSNEIKINPGPKMRSGNCTTDIFPMGAYFKFIMPIIAKNAKIKTLLATMMSSVTPVPPTLRQFNESYCYRNMSDTSVQKGSRLETVRKTPKVQAYGKYMKYTLLSLLIQRKPK